MECWNDGILCWRPARPVIPVRSDIHGQAGITSFHYPVWVCMEI